jgi:hypothetical protein
MIDYNQPDDDPIVADVRRAREEIAAQFNYDLTTLWENLRLQQPASGRTYVSHPPRRIAPTSNPPQKAVG